MLSVRFPNVHVAIPNMLRILENVGVWREDNRNSSTLGRTFEFPSPVCTGYANPNQRVEFWEERDSNPFFHLFEALWMLAGKNDIDFLTSFLPKMVAYSDDGITQHGAYGHRWKKHFGKDQLDIIVDRLTKFPNDRRCVLTMWDPRVDLGHIGKDFPCNTHVYFIINASTKALDMTVCCRSNDLIWGAYGSNVVHFSMLHEYMAHRISVPVGEYYQMSNNLHVYENAWEKYKCLTTYASDPERRIYTGNPYNSEITPTVMIRPTETAKAFDEDLKAFFSLGDNAQVMGYKCWFFRRVVMPLYAAHRAYKQNDMTLAISHAEGCSGPDWRAATVNWLLRRVKRRAERDVTNE